MYLSDGSHDVNPGTLPPAFLIHQEVSRWWNDHRTPSSQWGYRSLNSILDAIYARYGKHSKKDIIDMVQWSLEKNNIFLFLNADGLIGWFGSSRTVVNTTPKAVDAIL